MSIAVVYIARGKDGGFESAQRFFSSYKKYNSGATHTLYVIEKGWDYPLDPKELREIVARVGGKVYSLPDDGFDWGAYMRVVHCVQEDWVCFLNSHSEICAENWLNILFSESLKENVGLVGCTGSWSTWGFNWPFWEPSFRSIFVYPARLYREIRKFIKNYGNYHPFPNYHVRSNAFMLSTEIFTEYCRSKNIPSKKSESHVLESGRNGLSRFIESKSLDIVVCGKNGFSYKKEEWVESRTFRTKNQDNLLVKDNQTRIYENAKPEKRRHLSYKAWNL